MNGLLTRLRLAHLLDECEANGHATGATPAKTVKPITRMRLRAQLRLCDRRRRKCHQLRLTALMVIALALALVAGWQNLEPDPYGPAVSHDPVYGTLIRKVSWDIHEHCMVLRWVTPEGKQVQKMESCPW